MKIPEVSESFLTVVEPAPPTSVINPVAPLFNPRIRDPTGQRTLAIAVPNVILVKV